MSASDLTESDSRVLGVDGPDMPLAGDSLTGDACDGDDFAGDTLLEGVTKPFEFATALAVAGARLLMCSMHSFQCCCTSESDKSFSRLS